MGRACTLVVWLSLSLMACSREELSFELACQGSEKSHTQTDRGGVLATEDTTLEVKRHYAIIAQQLNSVMCDQWDDRQIHCLVQDHPKSKDKAFTKSYEEDFVLNRSNLQVSVNTKRTSTSAHLKIQSESDFSGQCQQTKKH